MPFLTLSPLTTYTYRQPVSFGEHRIMVRPRESYDQHLLGATLTIIGSFFRGPGQNFVFPWRDGIFFEF